MRFNRESTLAQVPRPDLQRIFPMLGPLESFRSRSMADFAFTGLLASKLHALSSAGYRL